MCLPKSTSVFTKSDFKTILVCILTFDNSPPHFVCHEFQPLVDSDQVLAKGKSVLIR